MRECILARQLQSPLVLDLISLSPQRNDLKHSEHSKNVILKLGPKGLFFLGEDVYHSIDAFTTNVKDAVGSGDALLAYATLTMKATGSLPLACVIGSIDAACECEIDGNTPITPDMIIEKLAVIKEEMSQI